MTTKQKTARGPEFIKKVVSLKAQHLTKKPNNVPFLTIVKTNRVVLAKATNAVCLVNSD